MTSIYNKFNQPEPHEMRDNPSSFTPLQPSAIYVWLVPSEHVLEQPGSWRIRKWDTEPFPEANYTLAASSETREPAMTIKVEGREFHAYDNAAPSARGTPARRVVCAAIRAADGEVVLGVRHYSRDMHEQIDRRLDGAKFHHRHDEDQGFVDQHGVYMSREDAYLVALGAGQIVRPEACGEGLNGRKLYSEGLY